MRTLHERPPCLLSDFVETIAARWYRIDFSTREYANGELDVLRGAFMEAYVASNAPVGMALFGGWSEDRSHYHVYVTPDAVRCIRPLLQAYSAKPQAPPHHADLAFLCGDEAGRFDAATGFEN